jgi:nickel-dependent lactate racemase
VAAAVDAPLDIPPLTELCRGRRRATVVVPDTTRNAQLDSILPVVLGRLSAGGIDPEDVTVLVACGTHPPAADEALHDLVGALPTDVTLIQHDSRDPLQLVEVGRIGGRGTIRLHQAAVETDLLVTIGPVRHHYFAGFGGGPKMLFPGIAGYEEIQANHSLVMTRVDERLVREARCEPGVLDGNPVAEEIRRAADLRPPDCAVCLVPGTGDGTAKAVAGRWRTAFREAVDLVRKWYEVPRAEYRLAVASAGGHPADATLIQAHKGLDAACHFLAAGGEVLYVAEIAAGLGSPEMAPFLEEPTVESILRRLDRRWVQYGHTALRLLEKAARYRVHLSSHMDRDLVERLGMRSAPDPAGVIADWRDRYPGELVAVFPSEPVYPRADMPAAAESW